MYLWWFFEIICNFLRLYDSPPTWFFCLQRFYLLLFISEGCKLTQNLRNEVILRHRGSGSHRFNERPLREWKPGRCSTPALMFLGIHLLARGLICHTEPSSIGSVSQIHASGFRQRLGSSVILNLCYRSPYFKLVSRYSQLGPGFVLPKFPQRISEKLCLLGLKVLQAVTLYHHTAILFFSVPYLCMSELCKWDSHLCRYVSISEQLRKWVQFMNQLIHHKSPLLDHIFVCWRLPGNCDRIWDVARVRCFSKLSPSNFWGKIYLGWV